MIKTTFITKSVKASIQDHAMGMMFAFSVCGAITSAWICLAIYFIMIFVDPQY